MTANQPETRAVVPIGEWRRRAACAEIGVVEIFFPEADSGDSRQARRICAGCPVRAECLEDALRFEQGRTYSFGVFGGLSGEQRRHIINGRKRQGRVA